MSKQAIVLAIIAVLSFPIGLVIGVWVGILVQDLRSMKNIPFETGEAINCPLRIPQYKYNSCSRLAADDR